MNAIKYFRLKVPMTQERLANELKVGQSTVAMWETNESMPRAEKLPELAQTLNCNIDDLFYDQPR